MEIGIRSGRQCYHDQELPGLVYNKEGTLEGIVERDLTGKVGEIREMNNGIGSTQ